MEHPVLHGREHKGREHPGARRARLLGRNRSLEGESVCLGRLRRHEKTQLDEQALTMYRRRSVGVIFQKFNLLPTLTALENVVLPGVLEKMPPDELDARGRSLLEDMGLSDRADHRPDALSGGEQQRVAIARALFFSPAILFADEPTGNLDMVSSDRLWSVLERLAGERNMIVLMVTHEAEAAARCRQVFVLRDGRNAGVIDAEELDPSELAARAASVAGPV